MYSGHHISNCMVNKPLESNIAPNASCCRRFKWKLRQLLLPCGWHHGSVLYIRSQKGLTLERERQIQTARFFIWHPYSPLKFYWTCFSVFFTYICFNYMAFHIFTDCPSPYCKLVLINDALGFVDITSNFLTGYNDVDNKIIVLIPKLIAKNYIKHFFLLDFIGSLPLQLVDPYQNCRYPFHPVMFYFKLLRLPSQFKMYLSVCRQIKLPYFWIVVSKCAIQASLLCHWMTFTCYQAPAMWANFYTEEIIEADPPPPIKTWLTRALVTKGSLFEKYVANLYSVCRIIIGSRFHSQVIDIMTPELLLDACFGIIGLLCIMHMLMCILSLVIHRQQCANVFNGRLKELEEYMIQMRIPKFLQQKIKMYMNYKYNGQFFNDERIWNTINTQIKNDINMHFCKRLVLNVPLFHGLPVTIINSIIFGLTHVLFMPGMVVVYYGNFGSSMYLISSGSVAVLNAAGKEIAHLKDGAYFGEVCLLHPDTKRQTTIIALEITEMYKLSREVFTEILKPHAHVRRRLERAVSVRYTPTPTNNHLNYL